MQCNYVHLSCHNLKVTRSHRFTQAVTDATQSNGEAKGKAGRDEPARSVRTRRRAHSDYGLLHRPPVPSVSRPPLSLSNFLRISPASSVLLQSPSSFFKLPSLFGHPPSFSSFFRLSAAFSVLRPPPEFSSLLRHSSSSSVLLRPPPSFLVLLRTSPPSSILLNHLHVFFRPPHELAGLVRPFPPS